MLPESPCDSTQTGSFDNANQLDITSHCSRLAEPSTGLLLNSPFTVVQQLGEIMLFNALSQNSILRMFYFSGLTT